MVRLTAEAVEVCDVACVSFGSLIKVDTAGCGLFPLVRGRQSIDAVCLCWDLRDYVMGESSR